ncbi:MAG TPA: LPXTG cell wall anchor domain-containing protein [Dactylosporangium sp.]|jgi:LPXTG-motif cell wall-anchored protein|nr:LPXTG cell wall anchor domain-containing protein [Dactylosporangium sp.]
MNLRGIARAAAAATVTALFIGGLGTPAHAADEAPGALLNIPDTGVWAATAPNKGCAGIDTGVAVADKDGWLFNKPDGRYTDLNYVFVYINGAIDDPNAEAFPLILNADGVFTFDLGDGEDPLTVEKALTAQSDQITAKSNATAIELPTKPAPAGVTGQLVDDGGWIKTPKGWGLVFGFAVSVPLLENTTFDLVRACAAVAPTTQPTTPAASPSQSGPTLPVTGDNTGLMVGAGVAMVAVGAVLFVVYRRRRTVKFVA